MTRATERSTSVHIDDDERDAGTFEPKVRAAMQCAASRAGGQYRLQRGDEVRCTWLVTAGRPSYGPATGPRDDA